MKYTKFGNSGLTISPLCPGTAPFGKQTDGHMTDDIVDEAAANALGVALNDSVEAYR